MIVGGRRERIPLFVDELENHFWQWNTTVQAKAQLIFVPVPQQ